MAIANPVDNLKRLFRERSHKKQSDFDTLVAEAAKGKSISADVITQACRDAEKSTHDFERAVQVIVEREEAVQRLASIANDLDKRQAAHSKDFSTLDSRMREVKEKSQAECNQLNQECRRLHEQIRESREAIAELWSHAPAEVLAEHDELLLDGRTADAEQLKLSWFNRK